MLLWDYLPTFYFQSPPVNSKICDCSSPVGLAPITFSIFNTGLSHCKPSHFLTNEWPCCSLFIPYMLAHCTLSIRWDECAYYPHFRWQNQTSESLSNLSNITQSGSNGPWFKYKSSGPIDSLHTALASSFILSTLSEGKWAKLPNLTWGSSSLLNSFRDRL